MESVDDYYVHKEEILYDDETWDDKHLIEAYNKSVDGIKKKIAREMGLVNGNDEHCDEEKEVVNKQKVSKNGQSKWKIGDFCRANYSVDGLEYEAKIIELLSDGQCVVKYCGYDNEEVVKLKHLKQSLGKQFRIAQNKAAANSENSDASDTCREKAGGMSHVEILPEWLPVSGVPAIPPPPPLNVMPLSASPDSESDALSTMLMSWYMSGYHTGYYQGLMQSKKQFQKFQKK